MSRSDADSKLLTSLIDNGRISIAELAKITGLSYTAIRNKLKRLLGNGFIEIKPLVSAKIAGTVAALLRIKTRNPARIIDSITGCNKIIGIMSIGEELVIMLYSRTKRDLALTIDKILSIDDDVIEYSIEYGRLPSNLKIPLKSSSPVCSTWKYNPLGRCSECIPPLRIRNNRGNTRK